MRDEGNHKGLPLPVQTMIKAHIHPSAGKGELINE